MAHTPSYRRPPAGSYGVCKLATDG